jgi:hypothetical protein
VLYTGYPDGQPHFMVRQRITDLPGLLAVATPQPVASALLLGPNPLRRGQPLEVRWSGMLADASAVADFFDVSGRLVATTPLARGGSVAEAGRGALASFGGSLAPGASASWPSGVYFGRVRGSRQPAARLVFLR